MNLAEVKNFDYEAAPKELVSACNLCEAQAFVTVSDVDRYGIPQPTVQCCKCGLVFLSPRMTAPAYRDFYENGTYRLLVSAYHGRLIDSETIRPEQREYADSIVSFIRPLYRSSWATLLDIGGSTGVVARRVGRVLNLEATVLEPSPEINDAEGVEIIRSTCEEFDSRDRQWNLILLCQTVDHLLDIAGCLAKVRRWLTRGGLFFVDIVDYEATLESKIDHPFNLTRQTAQEYLARAGFVIVATEAEGCHVRYACQGI